MKKYKCFGITKSHNAENYLIAVLQRLGQESRIRRFCEVNDLNLQRTNSAFSESYLEVLRSAYSLLEFGWIDFIIIPSLDILGDITDEKTIAMLNEFATKNALVVLDEISFF